MKPELLLPIGNTEAFYAAIKGGADAIYLGLRHFNARNRAKNFTLNQLQSLLNESKKANIKVYLTLNTLLKNSELPSLLDVLYQVSQTTLSSIIIQDWGTYYLAKKFFPKIPLHASTQMAFHNSVGAEYANRKQFDRVIMARELTLNELRTISKKSKIELEVFTHGSLCYSFSGLCLFSSFLGGMSANRGQCRQPCRRTFNTEKNEDYFFSLKDNQQLEIVPELMKIGISSLKVEGRMKSAEYVYRVAQAYRMVINDPSKIEQAKHLLLYDMGREKTSYFLGGNAANAITENPFLGIYIGNIMQVKGTEFSFSTTEELKQNYRIRVQPQSDMDSKAIKLKAEYGFTEVEQGGIVTLNFTKEQFKTGDKVFLIGAPTEKFRTKFKLDGKKIKQTLSNKKKQNILNRIGSNKRLHREELFIRINSLRWLRKLYLNKFDQLILNLTKNEWQQLDLRSPFMKKNINKFIVELPKFIPEDDIKYYRDLCHDLSKQGIKNFMLSHISQKLLLPAKIRPSVNENVYSLNDAAIQFLREDNIGLHIYPYEFDFDNLAAGKNRNGIVPLYYYPELFYSRMPVKIDHDKTGEYSYFRDRDHTYKRIVRDGVTIVIPKLPVSLFQYKDDIHKKGFRRFLIDLSYEKPSQNTFNRLQKRYKYSEAEQPGFGFNFKLGLS